MTFAELRVELLSTRAAVIDEFFETGMEMLLNASVDQDELEYFTDKHQRVLNRIDTKLAELPVSA